MSVFYRKYQNKNRQSVAYGKWFARAVTIGKTINIDELAKHMSEHNTPYSKGAIKGVLTDMIGCVREEGLAIFSAGIKTKKNGAPTSAEFSTTKHIDSVYMRARATGEFTRQELTKAGNVTELPKNYTDYHEEDEDEPLNPNGGSGSQSGSGTGSVTPSGGGSSQSGGDNGGSQNGGNSGSGTNTGGSTGGNTGGNSGSSQSGTEGDYRLVIYKYGNGAMSVTDDSEQEINSNDNVHSGSNVNVSVVSGNGMEPIAKVNGNRITLTENDGTYTGSFQMPTKGTVLEINSEPDEWDYADQD